MASSPYAGPRRRQGAEPKIIRERLLREAEGNVALKVTETGDGDFEVAGRGELQLGVLIESMRREGFELSISRPRVLMKTENGEKLEPIEEVTVDVDDAYTGTVIEKLSMRKGEMTDMRPTGAGKTRIVFHAPARGLIGYHGGIPHRHPRHRGDEPHVPGICPAQGQRGRPHQWRADFHRAGWRGEVTYGLLVY